VSFFENLSLVKIAANLDHLCENVTEFGPEIWCQNKVEEWYANEDSWAGVLV